LEGTPPIWALAPNQLALNRRQRQPAASKAGGDGLAADSTTKADDIELHAA